MLESRNAPLSVAALPLGQKYGRVF